MPEQLTIKNATNDQLKSAGFDIFVQLNPLQAQLDAILSELRARAEAEQKVAEPAKE